MIIRINTEAKTITVPAQFKEELEAYNKIRRRKGQEVVSPLEDLELNTYSLVGETAERVKDHTNKETIEKFMEEVKATDKELYKEYVALRDKVVGVSKKGKEMKTSFLTLKKWFYEKFPEQKPAKK